MRTGLSYNDVALVPQYNNVISRSIPDVSSMLTKNESIDIPIVAANMESVIGAQLTHELVTAGSIPIFHRFYRDLNFLITLVKKYPRCFVSWGVRPVEELVSFIKDNDLDPLGVCFDIAHGHSIMLMNNIEALRKALPHLEIIAGNVCTGQATVDLINSGVTAVKVGIGPGAACTTRNVTGFGVPQFTAVQDCAVVGKRMQIPIIADGGIRSSREMILALAAGANTVMVGSLFAQTKEAAGRGMYRGQASQAFQEDYYGGLKKGTVPEGVIKKYDNLRPAKEVIDELIGGLRSGMTYGGAETIEELQRKAEFIRVTEDYFK